MSGPSALHAPSNLPLPTYSRFPASDRVEGHAPNQQKHSQAGHCFSSSGCGRGSLALLQAITLQPFPITTAAL